MNNKLKLFIKAITGFFTFGYISEKASSAQRITPP